MANKKTKNTSKGSPKSPSTPPPKQPQPSTSTKTPSPKTPSPKTPSPKTPTTPGGTKRRGSYTSVAQQGSGSDSDSSNPPSPASAAAGTPSSVRRRNSGGGGGLQRRPSVPVAPLPQLNDKESEFFELVKSGDIEAVHEFLNVHSKDINVNRTDQSGYTALHFAVRRQDEPMVEFLLRRPFEPPIRIYDTILHAIKEHNLEITTLILNKYNEIKAAGANPPSPSPSSIIAAPADSKTGIKTTIIIDTGCPITGQCPKPHRRGSNSSTGSAGSNGEEEMFFDSEFHPVMTPLMLAAQEGSDPLMKLFYGIGERLETKQYHHNMGCECDICRKLDGDQDMTRAYQRYHLFKALCEPNYICFMARCEAKLDPVNYALAKIIKIREIIKRDVAYCPLFEDFEKTLEEFVAKLMQLCRNTTETEIFLSPKDPEEKERLPHLYPRMWYTVGLGLKDLVAESNFQSLVYKIWATDEWPDWDTYGWIYRALNALMRIIFWFLPAAIVLLAPSSKLGRQLACPLSRFLTYIGSYTYFLIALGLQNVLPYQRCNTYFSFVIDDDHCVKRGPPSSPLFTEWILLLYVFCFYINMFKRQQVSWYWRMRWNWFELLATLLLTATFGAWIASYLWTLNPANEISLNSTVGRQWWPQDCYENWADGFLALSCLAAGIRVLRFFTVFPTLGPIQIALGKQVVDFLSSIVIMLVMIFAFASALMGLYMPYKEFEGLDELDHHRMKKMDDSFHSPEKAFLALFYALYGHGGPDQANLLVWQIGNGSVDNITAVEIKQNKQTVTSYTGKFIFTLYGVMSGSMLWAMLSGYFAQTVSKVMENVDVEWKYARTELYLTFIKDTKLPPVFNWIPPGKVWSKMGRYFGLLGKKGDPRAGCSFRQCCFITRSKKTENWKELMKGYRALVVQLIFRYKNEMEEAEGEKAASKDDVQEIAEELAEIKALLKAKLGGGGNDNNRGGYSGGGGGGGGPGGGGGGGGGGPGPSQGRGNNPGSPQNNPTKPVVVVVPPGSPSGGSSSVASGAPLPGAKTKQGMSAKLSMLFATQSTNSSTVRNYYNERGNNNETCAYSKYDDDMTPPRPSGVIDVWSSEAQPANNYEATYNAAQYPAPPPARTRSPTNLETGGTCAYSKFDDDMTPPRRSGVIDVWNSDTTQREEQPRYIESKYNTAALAQRRGGQQQSQFLDPNYQPQPQSQSQSNVDFSAEQTCAYSKFDDDMTPPRRSGVLDVWSSGTTRRQEQWSTPVNYGTPAQVPPRRGEEPRYYDANYNTLSPPRGKMSPETKLQLAESAPPDTLFRNVSKMTPQELKDSSLWDSPQGTQAQVRYKGQPPQIQVDSSFAYPSRLPTTDYRKGNPYIEEVSDDDDTGGTDASCRVNYDTSSEASRRFSKVDPLDGGFHLGDSALSF